MQQGCLNCIRLKKNCSLLSVPRPRTKSAVETRSGETSGSSSFPPPLAGGRKSYLHNWIDDTSQKQESELFGGHTHDFEVDDCLTIRFYACCVRVLQKICHQLSTVGSSQLEKCALDIELHILQEELARLYLCGDGFADGEMGKLLDHANELRDNLLEILCEIGALLIRGKYRCKSNFYDLLPLTDISETKERHHGSHVGVDFVCKSGRTARLCLRF